MVITLQDLLNAVAIAQTRYLSTNPVDNSGNPLTSSADLRKGVKFLTVENVSIIGSMISGAPASAGIDAQALLFSIGDRLTMKAVMRMFEFFNAVASKDFKLLDAVTSLSIVSNAYAGASSRDALHFVTTGKGDESTSDIVRNTALVRKLQTLLPKVGVTTAPTQISRSFGKNGFCAVLGIGHIERNADGSRELVNVNKSNPFFRAVWSMLDGASENTLRTMRGVKKETQD